MDAFLKRPVIKCAISERKNTKTYEFSKFPLPSFAAFRLDCKQKLGIDDECAVYSVLQG